MILRPEATQRVIDQVGERPFLQAAYADVPFSIRHEILRHKAAAHDVAWMEVFRDDGAFRFRAVGPERVHESRAWRLHPREQTAIACLALALEIKTTVHWNEDPFTGRELSQKMGREQFDPSPLFRNFFSRVVADYVTGMAHRNPGNDGGPQTAAGNSAILLCMAIAMGDENSASRLIDECPHALHTPVRMDVLQPQLVGNHWIKPAFMALHFNQPQMLKLLADKKFDLGSPVRFDRAAAAWPNEEPSDLAGESDCVKLTLVELVQASVGIGRFNRQLPSTLAVIANHVKAQKGGWDSQAGQKLVAAAAMYMRWEGHSAATDLVDVFDDRGALNAPGVIRGLAVEGAKSGNRALLERLKDRIDWAGLAGPDFLPLALAQTPFMGDAPEVVQPLVLDLCRWCVEAGQGHLLGRNHLPEERFRTQEAQDLSHILAAEGMNSGVLLCLENGADPHAVDPMGHDMLWHAAKGQHADTEALIRSFVAKKSALEAIGDWMPSPAIQP